MQLLDMSGLVSITSLPNGEKQVVGVFDGVEVNQTLPFNDGVWVFDGQQFLAVPFPKNVKLAVFDAND